MLSFHSDPKVKEKYLNRVRAHIKADNLIRGKGWEDGKGCAVGCTLEDYNHKRYETELGIPEWLAYVEDKLFEGMSIKKSKTWPEVFLESIKPGIDLEKVQPEFMCLVLYKALEQFDHIKFPDVKTAIETVINLWKQEAAGSAACSAAWSAAWSAACSAACSAAESAARSAAWSAARSAARSADWSAAGSAAYDYFADGLIRILKELAY